jgi:hypothetical protein
MRQNAVFGRRWQRSGGRKQNAAEFRRQNGKGGRRQKAIQERLRQTAQCFRRQKAADGGIKQNAAEGRMRSMRVAGVFRRQGALGRRRWHKTEYGKRQKAEGGKMQH